MSKVYDPILCMMVEKSTHDAGSGWISSLKNDIRSVKTNRDFYRVMEKINNASVDGIISKEQHRELIDELNRKRIKGVNDAHPGGEFYQLRFSSGKIEGARLNEEEMRSYAESLLKKYGEKQVTLSQNGKVVKTFIAHDSSIDRAIRVIDADTGMRVGKVGNHYAVFYNGKVMIHCDTWQEAEEEMETLKKEIEKDKKK